MIWFWCAMILNVWEPKGGSPLLYGIANLGLLLFGAAPTAAINGIDPWQEIACPAELLNLNKIADICCFFKTIYAFHKVSLRAMPFMIFYLLCVLGPLPASRIHLHRGCVLRARSQALCECHPIRHAARISTSYKGVNACSWLLLHHCAMRQIRQMMQIITFFGQSQNVLWGKIWQSCSSLFWEEWWSTTWGILVQFATKLRSLFNSCDTTYDMFF